MYSIKCSLFIDGQICVERINVQEQNSNLTVPRRSQVILPSSNFSCHGRVTSFVARLSKNGSSNPCIQIWNPVSTNNYAKYKEFCANKTNNDDGQLVINVTGDAGVVEPGYCIGYYQPPDSYLIRNIEAANGGHISYRTAANKSLDEFFINHGTENSTLQPAITITFGKS